MTTRKSLAAAGACLLVAAAAVISATPVSAQTARATVRGRVTDTAGVALQGVILSDAADPRVATASGADGAFKIALTSGRHILRTHLIGFGGDSAVVEVPSAAEVRFRLRPTAQTLSPVLVEGVVQQGEAVALNRQRSAENLKEVTTDAEIRSIPNANAADAAARLPGVTLQRHEGEGAYIQVRGMDGNLSNITMNGAHLPGQSEDSPQNDRRAKLDGVPAELLGAIQLSKTLSPEMDADAIGGSVNLETKSGGDAPGLRLGYSYGRSDLRNAPQWLGSATWGGTFGPSQRFSAFLGYSADANHRVYDDVEPKYARILVPSTGDSSTIPITTSRREYFTDRYRTGATGRLDFRASDNTNLSFSGTYALFSDHAIRPRQDQQFSTSTAKATDDFTGTSSSVTVTSNMQRRNPIDHTTVLNANGNTSLGNGATLDYSASYARAYLNRSDAFQITFQQTKLAGSYDWTQDQYPLITGTGMYNQASALAFKSMELQNEQSMGRDLAASVNLTIPTTTNGAPSTWKFGARVRGEHKVYTDYDPVYSLASGGSYTLANVVSSFTDPGHYYGHYPINLMPDEGSAEAFYAAHPSMFVVDPTTLQASQLASFKGGEIISAGYGEYSVDVGAAHLMAGVRVEQTNNNYDAFQTVPGANHTIANIAPVSGGKSYMNVFPSAQLRYAIDDQTNLRVAVTTAIARPLYYDLAPHAQVTAGALPTDPGALSVGNPDLKPMRSVNEDVLLEHFFSNVGAVEAGAFAKQVNNFIYSQSFTYQGGLFDGYSAVEPQNAKDGTLEGFEAGLRERFSFLPGALSGLGIDANGTWSHSHTSTPTRSSMVLPRNAEWTGNVTGSYAIGRVTTRVAYQYVGTFIDKVGNGLTDPVNGDKWMMAHAQVDASINLSLPGRAEMVLEGINLNNRPFGYYLGGIKRAFSQREYYGTTTILLVRWGY
jgi:TonB-dependent receptor